MTVAEIIEQQRKLCEIEKQARLQRACTLKPSKEPQHPKTMNALERERAFIEDRTYDGNPPQGGINSILRKENPDEYVARDGTRTFVPWRYLSMQDLELPDNGNPYRKPAEVETKKRMIDPWGRPSGYVGSAAGPDMSPEYDPWAITGTGNGQQAAQAGGWDDWLAPAPMPPPEQQYAPQSTQWNSWMAPAPEQTETSPVVTEQPVASMVSAQEVIQSVDTNGTLDIMRNMRP